MRAEGKLNYSRRPVIRQEMTAAVNYARFRTVFANYPQLLDAPRNTRIRKQGNLSNFYYPGNRLFIFPFLFSISFQTYDSHDRSRLRINGRVRSFPWTILCKFHAIPDTLRVKLKIDLETTGNEWQGFRTIFWKLPWTLIERCWLVLSDTTSGKTIFQVLLGT